MAMAFIAAVRHVLARGYGVLDDRGTSDDLDDTFTPSGIACARGSVVAASSNFAIQYNYACASIATAIMVSHNDLTDKGLTPDYPEPHWAEQCLLSVVFVGSVVGMLTMGFLGDLLGIKRGLVLTNTLTVLGALCSALLSWGSSENVWRIITASRFVLGVGVGGNYPLSAAKASQGMSVEQATKKAGVAFFWQGPGGLAPYVVGLGLLALPRTLPALTSLQFRVLLGAGAFPALIVLVASLCEPDVVAAKRDGRLQDALRNPAHWRTLVGTAGTWFLFDVAFYGTIIFSPTILGSVFGAQQSLQDLAQRAAMMCVLGMVGTALGLAALPVIGSKALNTLGLALASLLFGAFAFVYRQHPEQSLVLLSFLCLLFFVLYMGPNVATFLLPVEAFPEDVRSTFHGLSAAAAKLGAMAGALLFPVINDNFGIPAVMLTQATICAAGALLSQLAVPGEAAPFANSKTVPHVAEVAPEQETAQLRV